jgi:5'(3')-deoxyribonucleotidase
MMDRIVVLDADGVLLDFIGPVLDTIASITGRVHQREDVYAFDFAKCLGLTASEKKAVQHRLSDPAWWLAQPPCPGAQDGVRELAKVAEIYVATAPWESCESWAHARRRTLAGYFGIASDKVLPTHAKHLVCADFVVDDRTEVLVEWERTAIRFGHFSTDRAIQWQTPHNRRDVWNGRSTSSWFQLAGWVRAAA